MTTFSTEEQIENLNRTIVATEKNIADLQEVTRINKMDLYKLRGRLADEKRAEALLNSDRSRWMRATKALRKEGVKFLANVQACCRGCIGSEKLGLDEGDSTTPYGYTFGGQGNRISWDPTNGDATQKQDRWSRNRLVTAYINHGNGSGERIAAAFRAEGFEVEWDGTTNDCVQVKF